MNIYELSIGPTQHFVAARDEEHAYEQGTNPEQFPDIHFLPFRVTKVEVPGHTISVTSDVAGMELQEFEFEEQTEFDLSETADKSIQPAPKQRGRKAASA